jgi:hypothetical protein
VQFGADGAGGLQLHLIGGVRLQVAHPAWAADRPPTLDAHGVQLDLRYRDLLANWRGGGTAGAGARRRSGAPGSGHRRTAHRGSAALGVGDGCGRGRSTAVLLWTQGTISHLLVEVAGLDVAQGLGVFLVGGDALPVTCGAADLRIRDGQLTPTVLLVDTCDSTLWVEGQASFVRESLALTARVHPKDFSPLSLRSPLRVEGTFAAPRVQLERGALLGRLGPAALLALVTPLAGLLPLLDTGTDGDAPFVASCSRLMRSQTARAPARPH